MNQPATHDKMPKNTDQLHQLGLKPLTADQLTEAIVGNCFAGLYPPHFHYVLQINEDKTLWGKNNYGTEDNGVWAIDPTTGILTVSWQSWWDAHSTLAFQKDNMIHQFDAESGNWRTSLVAQIGQDELARFG